MATPDATTAQALLALYGALDQAVTSTGSAEIEATVERYLPGSTGANAGWYDELLGFLDAHAGRTHGATEPPPAPNLLEALTVLQAQAATTVGQDQTKTTATSTASVTGKRRVKRGAGVRADAPPERRPLSTVQKSRMAYAIGALIHLPDWYQPQGLSGPLSGLDGSFSQTLKLAGGPDDSELLDLLRRDFTDRNAYPNVMQVGARRTLVDPDVARVPLCQPKVMTVRGYPCLVLTTEFQSQTVSLNELKNVVDPRNWDKCLSNFFCSMDTQVEGPDGWSRVLEHVSTTCWIPNTHMTTALKYWKEEDHDDQLGQPTAWVNYALDTKPPPDAQGDGLMVVDEGFIRMTSTAGDSSAAGVRVRTRKVAGFRHLGLTPWGIFACAMGYGDQGIDMLLNGIAARPSDGAGWADWKPSVPPTGGSTPSPDQPAHKAPTDTSSRAVELAVNMFNEYVDDVSEKSAAIAAKWATGVVPIAETMAFTTELAARLTTDPWRYLELLRDPDGVDK